MNEKQQQVANWMFRELLGRQVQYHSIIAKATGCPNLAIMWGQIYYWSDKGRLDDGWVYKTTEEMYEETGLTRRMQETARKLGNELKLLESKRMGTPGKMHYRVNYEGMKLLLAKYVPEVQPVEVEERQFNLLDEIKILEESAQRHLNVIALFLEEKVKQGSLTKTLTNHKALSATIRRHCKMAKELTVYEDTAIYDAVQKAKKVEGWTLETVNKMISK